MTKFKCHTCVISYHFRVCIFQNYNAKSSVSNKLLYNITQFGMNMFINSPCPRYISTIIRILTRLFYLILMKAKPKDIDTLF